jgi:hypothetical protein
MKRSFIHQFSLKLFTVLAFAALTFGIPSCISPCPDFHLFFDIQNISTHNYREVSKYEDLLIPENDSVSFEEYIIKAEYDVELYSKANIQLPFVTTSAYAHSCGHEGDGGSIEGLDTVFLITQKDYNGFMSGDTINTIIQMGDYNLFGSSYETLEEFVLGKKEKIYGKDGFRIKITQKPQDLSIPYSFTLVVKLGNGEEYVTATQDVYFK